MRPRRSYEKTVDIVYVLGTRPEIIRSAPIISELSKRDDVSLHLVHTGQHYEHDMSGIFLDELKLPDIPINLEVGSGSDGWQTAEIMKRTEKVLDDLKPDLLCVFGDTNSTLGAALAAVKVQVPVVHIEAGARSFNLRMAEEVNRRLVDHCSSLLLAVSDNCANNLKKENVLGDIHVVGDPLYDCFSSNVSEASKLNILGSLGLKKNDYIILTLHRAENVDHKETLGNIIQALVEIEELRIAFPVHPRTKRKLLEFGLCDQLKKSNVVPLRPLKYGETLNLLLNSELVMTDSGGLQKEAFWAKAPCLTLRDVTEWVETVSLGVNYLGGNSKDTISTAFRYIMDHYDEIKRRLERAVNPYGDGSAAAKIAKALLSSR